MSKATDFYNTADIAEIIGISVDTARMLMKKPDFPSFKAGKNYKVYKPAFEKWLMEHHI